MGALLVRGVTSDSLHSFLPVRKSFRSRDITGSRWQWPRMPAVVVRTVEVAIVARFWSYHRQLLAPQSPCVRCGRRALRSQKRSPIRVPCPIAKANLPNGASQADLSNENRLGGTPYPLRCAFGRAWGDRLGLLGRPPTDMLRRPKPRSTNLLKFCRNNLDRETFNSTRWGGKLSPVLPTVRKDVLQ
jgi:hypothetical protein